jgi:hypothetical protein
MEMRLEILAKRNRLAQPIGLIAANFANKHESNEFDDCVILRTSPAIAGESMRVIF